MENVLYNEILSLNIVNQRIKEIKQDQTMVIYGLEKTFKKLNICDIKWVYKAGDDVCGAKMKSSMGKSKSKDLHVILFNEDICKIDEDKLGVRLESKDVQIKVIFPNDNILFTYKDVEI